MKVKIQGFELKFSNGIEIPEFFQLLESNEGKSQVHHDDEYLYLVDIKDNYIIGLILRFSNIKKFITTSRGVDGKLLIKIPDLTDENLEDTEASIFCINPDTMRGAFYTYRRSLTKSLLTSFFRSNHNFLKSKILADLTNEYSQFDPKKRKNASKKAKEQVHGYFKFDLIATPATLNTLLDSYDEISQMSVGVKEGLPDAGIYSPAEPFVSSTNLTTKFEKSKLQSNLELIKAFVRKATKKLNKEDALKLYGKLENGSSQWLAIGENINEFEVFEFDRYVDMLPDKDEEWNNYVNCPATIRLINLLKSDTAIFGDQPINSDWRLPSAKTENQQVLLQELDEAS
ncbi:hypothetical protein [Paraglaciecola sp.]|uniref:hypothetical protein n=1 Tax=Paraglaciecola sp. TaxID=1920173 RepID=UPI003267BF06